MHNHHLTIFGIPIPVCMEELKAAAAFLPFWSYYIFLTKMFLRGLWLRVSHKKEAHRGS